MATDIQAGAVGTFLRWTVKDAGVALDVSAASAKTLKIVKPDATNVTKTLVNSTKAGDAGDGTDGRVEYVLESGVVNLSGRYTWQLLFTIGSWTDHSEPGYFEAGSVLF